MRVLVAEGGEGLGFWREELIRRRFGRAVEKDMVEEEIGAKAKGDGCKYNSNSSRH